MTKAELNELRPGDKVVYEAANRTTKGKITAVFRDSHYAVKWSDGTTDTCPITEEGDRHLKRG
jgi:hypothetical protein